MVVGVIVPDVGSLVIAAVPISPFVDVSLVRMTMLAAALGLPLAIGMAALSVTTRENRPRGAGLLVAVLRGYPFAAVLAVLLALLALVATGRKLRSLSKRWEDAHVPVIVKPGAYETVLELVRQKLDSVGLRTIPRDAGILISGPPKLLDLIAGRALGDLIPDRLQLLVGENLEVLVYPSDLAISGTRERVTRARAAIATELAEAPAYMTTSAEAQTFEDKLERLGPGAAVTRPAETVTHVRSLDPELVKLAIPFEEWETLYRMRLQLERDALAAARSSATDVVEPVRERVRGASRMDFAIALATAGLVVVDMALLISARRRRDRGRK
jgi:hypothetical protein